MPPQVVATKSLNRQISVLPRPSRCKGVTDEALIEITTHARRVEVTPS
jgi:hypothetical protein